VIFQLSCCSKLNNSGVTKGGGGGGGGSGFTDVNIENEDDVRPVIYILKI